jgi:hypothetical protein
MTSTQQTTGQGTRGGGVSRTVLIVGVVAALVVGGLAGTALGWKIEQRRVKDDLANIRPVGKVTAVNGNSLTIALQSSSGTRTYVVTSGTKVDRAREGTTSDVKKGSTVLVKNFTNDQGHLEASEIVVLPDSTRLGTR